MKVAIFGASGFVGTAVVRRLLTRDAIEVVPIIRSSASAWELSRHAIPMTSVDVLSLDAVRAALKGVTHVVNCTRGADDVMIDGLKNLLNASREQSVKRFVHLSSVAVYGDPPPATSTHESAPTKPKKNSYGWTKLEQDNLVAAAHAAGLSTVVLCPPNITGPDSAFALQVLGAIQNGQFALMDDGNAVCAVVDVANLAAAVEAALFVEAGDGKRLFVTDDESVTWGQVARDLLACLDDPPPLDTIERHELARLVEQRIQADAAKGSLLRSAKHLVSGDVRAALRQDPWIARIDGFARGLVSKLPETVEDKLRRVIAGPGVIIPRPRNTNNINVQLTGQQLRGVRHMSEKAKQVLGYRPVVSYLESMSAFRKCYRSMHATSEGEFRLLAELA